MRRSLPLTNRCPNSLGRFARLGTRTADTLNACGVNHHPGMCVTNIRFRLDGGHSSRARVLLPMWRPTHSFAHACPSRTSNKYNRSDTLVINAGSSSCTVLGIFPVCARSFRYFASLSASLNNGLRRSQFARPVAAPRFLWSSGTYRLSILCIGGDGISANSQPASGTSFVRCVFTPVSSAVAARRSALRGDAARAALASLKSSWPSGSSTSSAHSAPNSRWSSSLHVMPTGLRAVVPERRF